METLISFATAQKLDARTQKEYKIAGQVLMERAGYECTKVLCEILKKNATACTTAFETKLVFVCGASNNGGDAQVMARLLHEKINEADCFFDKNIRLNIQLAFCSEPKSPLAKEQRKILDAHLIPYTLVSESKQLQKMLSALKKHDYIIDGISGVGQKGIFRYPKILQAINNSLAQVISIDVPSGLPPDYEADATIVESDVCISMGFAKQSMYHPQYKKYCKKIVVVNPGFPQKLMNEYKTAGSSFGIRLNFSDLPHLWKRPASDTYKHKRGIVAIAAGCDTSPGAAFLALQMASHSPAGLVYALLDLSIQKQASLICPSAITGTNLSDLLSDSKHSPHACAIGCGWGKRSPEELEAFFNLNSHCALVLDADALQILPRIYKKTKIQKRLKILTPHLGELRHLSKTLKVKTTDSRLMAEAVANHYNAIVIAKGATNYIVAPKSLNSRVYIDSQCPSLATAGSGDVLAGLVAGIAAYYIANDTAQTWQRLIKASHCAVLLQAQAGKQLHNANAQDIIKAISQVYKLV